MQTVPGVALIVPALDEAAVIGRVVREMRAALPSGLAGRIIVVDNGSSDATARVAEEAGAEVVAEPHRGYGRACAAGVAAAVGVDYLVFLDGDGADLPSDLPRILEPILSGGADLVVGVRRRRERGSMTPWQVAGNRLAATAIHLLYGVRVGDLGPFRAIRRSDLKALEMAEMTFGWSTEMVIKSLRAGLRYREVEVGYRRRVGVSKVGGTLAGSVRAGGSILRTAFAYSRWKLPDGQLGRARS